MRTQRASEKRSRWSQAYMAQWAKAPKRPDNPAEKSQKVPEKEPEKRDQSLYAQALNVMRNRHMARYGFDYVDENYLESLPDVMLKYIVDNA